MKKYLSLLAMMMFSMTVLAQEASDSLFKGKFRNTELNIQCQLNLYEDIIEVPGLELETCYGFLQGQINGCWMILKVKELQDDTAVVRVVSEKGSDAQDLKLTISDQRHKRQQIRQTT